MATYKPIKKSPGGAHLEKAPTLSMGLLFNVLLCWERDYDAQTGLSTFTRCFFVLFVPVFALDAYRARHIPREGRGLFDIPSWSDMLGAATEGVELAPERYAFAERVPLSRAAKVYNCIAFVVMLVWFVYSVR